MSQSKISGRVFIYFMTLKTSSVSIVILAMTILIVGCRKEKFTTDSGDLLLFARDTISFDTVFSTIGSTTKFFTVINPHSKSIRISEIKLEGGQNSQFRINVDGIDGGVHQDVEIMGGDSLYIFVEVTVDPNNSSTPFIIEDRITFLTNGTVQKVVLNAWGQDANFHGGLSGVFTFFPLECDEVWNNDKPHVIYGKLLVEEGCTLTINAGVQVYVHAKSGIFVNGGTIIIQGQKGNEVVFQGDRLEPLYQDLTGQWGIQFDIPIETGTGPQIASIIRGGIWIFESPGSSIDWAIIKNGNIGIQVDTTGVALNGTEYSTTISNTKIENMAGYGLWAQGATLRGSNLLISNCASAAAYLSIGGRYQMDNCTFANYGTASVRTQPTFALNNYYEDVNQNLIVRPLVNCSFRNCIMFGSNAFLNDFNEFVIDVEESGSPQYLFEYCLVDTDINVNNGSQFNEMKNGLGPFFLNPGGGDFHISTNDSRMFGQPFETSPFSDLDDVVSSNPFYKGCYNYVP